MQGWCLGRQYVYTLKPHTRGGCLYASLSREALLCSALLSSSALRASNVYVGVAASNRALKVRNGGIDAFGRDGMPGTRDQSCLA